MRDLLTKLFQRQDLTHQEALQAMNEIFAGSVCDSQIAAFLGALAGKGEAIEEIAGLATAMRSQAIKIPVKDEGIIDTCGTGGDGAHTFNISTTCSFVVAAAGLKVVKHGNRAISSRSGSADVLEALQIPINLPPELVARSIEDKGFGFLFARALHPAMKSIAQVRKDLGVRSVFNLLGPLTNPALTSRQLIGIYDGQLLEKLAYVLKELGSKDVLLVHGEDGLDEITLTGKTRYARLKDEAVTLGVIDPKDYGFGYCQLKDLEGGDALDNAAITLAILKGEDQGPKRDVVVINSAASLMVGGVCQDLAEGIQVARTLIDKGRAYEKLASLRETNA